MTVVVVGLLVVIATAALVMIGGGQWRRERRSIREHGTAMGRLQQMSAYLETGTGTGHRRLPEPVRVATRAGVVRSARPLEPRLSGTVPSRPGVDRAVGAAPRAEEDAPSAPRADEEDLPLATLGPEPAPFAPSSSSRLSTTFSWMPLGQDDPLVAPIRSSNIAPGLLPEPRGRGASARALAPGAVGRRPRPTAGGVGASDVRANARLTATTGLLLAVLFFVEGLTLPVIGRYLSWHVAIGLALVPPVLLKTGSTLWRFARYYLGDERYVRAGPPHPLLRFLGPFVILSTGVLIGSGIILWWVGPQDHLMRTVHKLSFVLWFGVMAVHFLAHIGGATSLARADRRRARRNSVSTTRLGRAAVVTSLVLGLLLGVVGMRVATGWSNRPTPVRSQTAHASPLPPGTAR